MSQFGKCNGGGRRSAHRQSAPLMAVIATLRHTYSAILVDVSCTGVRLRGEELPGVGDELMLTIETVRGFGTIAWKHDGECGIAFDEPLAAADVDELRRRASNSHGYSPELRAALDDWNVGLAR